MHFFHIHYQIKVKKVVVIEIYISLENGVFNNNKDLIFNRRKDIQIQEI